MREVEEERKESRGKERWWGEYKERKRKEIINISNPCRSLVNEFS